MPGIWQILVGVSGLLAVITFVVYLITAISFLNRPFIGAMVTHTLVVNAGQEAGDTAWPGQKPDNVSEGVILSQFWQRGDRIIAINGENLYPTEALTDYATARSSLVSFLNNLNSGENPEINFTVLTGWW